MVLNRIIAELPSRQKWLIIFTVVSGLIIFTLSLLTVLPFKIIFFYSIGIPMILLMTDFIIDLNDNATFGIWYILSIVMFLISLLGYHDERFRIVRSSKFNINEGVNQYMSEYSVNSLKSLFVFLTLYWPLNKLYQKDGLYIINTYRFFRWYHDEAKRRITGTDVAINIILFLSIVLSCLF